MWDKIAKLTGAVVLSLTVGIPLAVRVLLGFIILDIVTGVIAASINGELSSDISWKGMLKKVFELTLVVMAALIDVISTEVFIIVNGQTIYPFEGIPWVQAVAGFYIIHEIISILENAGHAGIPMPPFIVEALSKVGPTKTSEQVHHV